QDKSKDKEKDKAAEGSHGDNTEEKEPESAVQTSPPTTGGIGGGGLGRAETPQDVAPPVLPQPPVEKPGPTTSTGPGASNGPGPGQQPPPPLAPGPGSSGTVYQNTGSTSGTPEDDITQTPPSGKCTNTAGHASTDKDGNVGSVQITFSSNIPSSECSDKKPKAKDVETSEDKSASGPPAEPAAAGGSEPQPPPTTTTTGTETTSNATPGAGNTVPAVDGGGNDDHPPLNPPKPKPNPNPNQPGSSGDHGSASTQAEGTEPGAAGGE
ncbi:hypothetical protein AK88_05680, partial [Plasmodium fragile]